MANPTHYFVYCGHSTQTKNKLQKAFDDYINSLAGTIVKAANINQLKKEIIDKSIELNQQHNRCQPLKVSFESKYLDNGYMMSGFYFTTFYLIKGYERND